tara:strand:+ start:70 stop:327 length:258 start_codon:yes stop_codon:yes gene_type:complete
MWIAIKTVPIEQACVKCNTQNIIVHSITSERIYGKYCSFDCQNNTHYLSINHRALRNPQITERPTHHPAFPPLLQSKVLCTVQKT